MDRDGRRLNGSFHIAPFAFMSLVVATPALALPRSLPFVVGDDTRLFLLIGSAVLLFAALVMRLLRNRDDGEVAGSADVPRSYGMRFFPTDRPIALE
jgi:hypothetical protein